jgi:diaminopimelate epimerase
MSASSLVTCLLDLNEFEKVINVYNDGGKVQCIVHKQQGEYYIDLIGNASYLYHAEIEVDLQKESFTIQTKNNYNEQFTYEKLQTEVQHFLRTELKG